MRIGNFNFEFYKVRKHNDLGGISGLFDSARDFRPFARADVQSIFMMIAYRLANVVYHAKIEYPFTNTVINFIRENYLILLNKCFYEGAISLNMKKLGLESVGSEDWGEGDNVTMLDDVYRATGRTRAQILSPHLELLDAVNDSDLNLIMNYGAMGILSPENSSRSDGYLDDTEIDKLHSEYQKKYGIRFGKWALMITRQPMKFQGINLPIGELELSAKRRDALASIMQALSVPSELHALFENAKYQNRNEAELDMYGTTITYWATFFIKFIEKCYRWEAKHDEKGIGYLGNEFWFDIVNVPALAEANFRNIERAEAEVEMWQKMKAASPEKASYCDDRIAQLIDSL